MICLNLGAEDSTNHQKQHINLLKSQLDNLAHSARGHPATIPGPRVRSPTSPLLLLNPHHGHGHRLWTQAGKWRTAWSQAQVSAREIHGLSGRMGGLVPSSSEEMLLPVCLLLEGPQTRSRGKKKNQQPAIQMSFEVTFHHVGAPPDLRGCTLHLPCYSLIEKTFMENMCACIL